MIRPGNRSIHVAVQVGMRKLWLRPTVWIVRLVVVLLMIGFLAGCGGKY